MKGYEYQSDFARKYVAEGRVEGYKEGLTEGLLQGVAKGRAEGLAEGLAKGLAQEAAFAVLTVLRARGLAIPDSACERILVQKNPEQLRHWLEKAAVADSVAAILDVPSELPGVEVKRT